MDTLEKAINWIYDNSIDGNGIAVSSRKRVLYPEVTGYYIPSLLNFGEKDLAISYAQKLCEIQTSDGAWLDSDMNTPYIFDTGQVLKGLLAINDLMPEVEHSIIKGINWILSCMSDEGRLVQKDSRIWGKDTTHCNDLIHLYTLSPIFEAARKFDIPEYEIKANKILNYYITNFKDEILNYSLFSHFYAYVIEALIDCGEIELANAAMENFEKYTKESGAVCAYNDVEWCCSVATFQFAVIWYKLGMVDKATKSFEYMCSLQNESGGWFGSYYKSSSEILYLRVFSKLGLTRKLYAYNTEISWANKFYLDATYLKNISKGR